MDVLSNKKTEFVEASFTSDQEVGYYNILS